MSCCGCASRVLKLQSEIRSWKSKLGDEKREKKMILKWITAAFGYDVKVEIEKESRLVRLQATENKDAMSKAIIKSAIGSEEECGVMVMEVKLEDDYYEPFEDPEFPEFPIMEINRMSTTIQQPILNTGISAFGHLSQHSAQTLSITTPMEVTSTPLEVASVKPEPELLYIGLAGNLEDGTTLEAPNGQSYIIVSANEPEEISLPLQYATVVNEPVGVNVNGIGNQLFRSPSAPNQDALSYLLPPAIKPPPPPIILSADNIQAATVISNPVTEMESEKRKSNSQPAKSATRKKPNLPSISKSNAKSPSKKKSFSESGVTDAKSKSASSKVAVKGGTDSATTMNLGSGKQMGSGNQYTEGDFVVGLTMRERAEVFVHQKAREAVEKVSNGFRCTVCEENQYTYSTYNRAISHTKTHFESKPYKCNFCDELFAIQRELLTHRRSVHSKPKGSKGTTSRCTQSKGVYKSFIGKSLISKTGDPLRVSFSGNNASSSNCASKSKSTMWLKLVQYDSDCTSKSTMVQASIDKSSIRGPTSVSNEILAAILEAGVKVTLSSSL